MDKENSQSIKNISSEQYNHLSQIQCREECKEELMKWGKGKFWIIITIVPFVMGFIGFWGGKSLIQESVRENIKESLDIEMKSVGRTIEIAENAIAEANKAATRAEYRASAATLAGENADKLAKGYAENVSKLQQALNTAQSDLDILRNKVYKVMDEYANLTGETGHVKGLVVRDINNIATRLTAIEELVRNLVNEENKNSYEELLRNYEADLRKAEQSAEELTEQFNENSKYYIRLYYVKEKRNLSDKLYNELSMIGFKTSSFDMLNAKERLWPVETRTPYAQEKSIQDTSLVSDNIITYASDVDMKIVDEVVDLLGSTVAASDLKILTREFFIRRYGDPFLANISPNEFLKTNLIEIYLGKKD